MGTAAIGSNLSLGNGFFHRQVDFFGTRVLPKKFLRNSLDALDAHTSTLDAQLLLACLLYLEAAAPPREGDLLLRAAGCWLLLLMLTHVSRHCF